METWLKLYPYLSLVGVIVLVLMPVMLAVLRLMELPDRWFPGRLDKLLWLVVLVVFNLLGAIAFFVYLRRREDGTAPPPPPGE